MAGLPPVFIEFLGRNDGVKRAMADVRREAKVTADESESAFAKTGRLSTAALTGIGLAAVGAAAGAVKMAADFQTQMTRVRTGAGETAANMGIVSQGVLAMAGQVGQSTEQLTVGLYTVESAGYHGSAALDVLRASAMGAKVGAADLGTVTDAVTTALNAYKLGSDQATATTNALIATEAEGKTTMEALSGAMATVLPTAATAKVGLNEVLGAMATMTAQGTPAADAATYLKQTIANLSNPTGKASQEMKSLGLDSVAVSQNLGRNGLASTLEMLTDAIQKKMGPAGTVLIDHLQKAAANTTEYQKVLANLPPAQQTYIGALADMVGGTKSMQAALELSGPHLQDFKDNTAGIAEHVKAGGQQIEGWKDVQGTLNQKLAEAKASAQAMAIQVGQYLMPAVKAAVGVIAEAAGWLSKHATAAKIAAGIIGGVLVIALAALTAALYEVAAAALANPVTWIVLAVVALIAAIVELVLHWRTVWGWIKTAGEAVAHALVAAWRWLADATVSIWHSITSWVVGAWRSVASFFSSAWHTVVDPIVGGWRWLERTTSAVFGAVAAFFRRWWPLLLVIFAKPIADIISAWNHWHKQAFAITEAGWHAISSFFVGLWQDIASVAAAGWRLFAKYVLDPVEALFGWLYARWLEVAHWLQGQWALVALGAKLIWAEIKKYIVEPLEACWREVVSLADKIGTGISSAFSAARDFVRGIVHDFESIGSDIVRGIVRGITSVAHLVGEKLKSMADDALKDAKNFLGIKSPSTVMADQVGRWIPHGIAQGISAHGGVARTALATLAGQLSAQPVGVGPVLGAGALGGGAFAGGAGPREVQVTTIVQLDSKVLAKAVQPHAIRRDRRNAQPGMVYTQA